MRRNKRIFIISNRWRSIFKQYTVKENSIIIFNKINQRLLLFDYSKRKVYDVLNQIFNHLVMKILNLKNGVITIKIEIGQR